MWLLLFAELEITIVAIINDTEEPAATCYRTQLVS